MLDAIKRVAGPYTGAGTLALPFGFKTLKAADIGVLLAEDGATAPRLLREGDDFDLVLNRDQDTTPGGRVNLKAALSQNQVAVVISVMPYDQTVGFTNFTRWPPAVVNDALDRIVMLIQQLAAILGQAILIPPTSATTPEEFFLAVVKAKDYAEQAAASAEAAKESEEKTAAYAKAAEIIAPYVQELQAVAGGITEVKLVAAVSEAVKIVARNIDYVKIDAQNIQAIIDCAALKSSIITVAGSTQNIAIVAGSINYVNAVGGIAADVVRVSQSLDDVKTVSRGMADIQKVAGDLGASAVCEPVIESYGHITDPVAVACTPTGGYIKQVADNIGAVHTNAENIEDIKFLAANWPDKSLIRDDVTGLVTTWSSRKLWDLIGTPVDLVALFDRELATDADSTAVLPPGVAAVPRAAVLGPINDQVIAWNTVWSSQKIHSLIGDPQDLVAIFEQELVS